MKGKPCRIEGCGKFARGNGAMCDMHEKRRHRGQPLDGELRIHPREKLHAAALAYANVDSEDDLAFKRAGESLDAAALAFAESSARQREAARKRWDAVRERRLAECAALREAG